MRQLIFILLAIIGVSQAQTIQYIGAPTTTVISRGNFRTDSIFYLPKRSKAPTDTAALRYQISDSSLYAWTGSQWRKVGADADTLVYSTRAWRQKGDDSLAARINLKVNISDTASMLTPYLRKSDTTAMLTAYLRKGDTASMLSPYYRSATASAALALKLNISDTSTMLTPYIRHAGYGLTKSGQSFLVDTLNIATRAWRQKGIDSVVSIIPAAGVGGSGTTNRIAKFTASSTIGNSLLSDDGVELKYTGADGATVQGTTSAFLSLYGTGDNYIQFKDAAGTAGRIQYNHTSDYMSFNTASSERLRIFANGRVFVGASPTDAGYQLDVNGTARINNALQINKSDGGQAINIVGNSNTASIQQNGSDMYFNSNTNTTGGGFYFRNSSSFTTRMAIDAGGNVGIGVTPSPWSGVSPSLQMGVSPFIASTGQYLFLASNTYYDGTNAIYTSTGSAATYAQSEGRHIFNTAPIGTAGAVATYTERMRIFNNGRVGINTTTDAGYQLDINGTLRSVNGANFATTSGNVGIGTASPSAKLDIAYSTNPTTATPHILLTTGGTSKQAAITAESFSVSGLVFSVGDGTLVDRMTILRSNGNVGIGTTSPSEKLHVSGNVLASDVAGSYPRFVSQVGAKYWEMGYRSGTTNFEIREDGTTRFIIDNGGEVFINTDSDAGDYKLQVSGNALVTAGKLDITTNTGFGLSVTRSGTSVVAGQINNSNGILYYGAESSTGGGLFTGSSAYAAVIGSGAAYPLQFATNNVTRATLNTDGELLINTLSDQGAYNLQINGSMYNTGQVTRGTINTIGTGAQLSTDSTTNIPAISINQSLTGASAQSLISATTTWNTTGNPSLLEFNVTNTASGATANYLRISDGTNIFRVTKDAGLFTSAPSGGTARKWKFGSAATVSPTSPNRTIQIEVDGVVYYLHAKTTND